MFWHFALTALVSTSLLACGGAQKHQPRARAGFKLYLKTLRSPEPRPAYNMLSREQQKQQSFEEFALQWKESEAERLSQAEEIERSLGANAISRERAIAEYKDGRSASLSRNPEGWRLDAPFVPRSQAQTPRDAIDIFAAAITAKSFPAIMRVLSSRQRDGLQTQLSLFSTSLEAQLGDAKHEIYVPAKDRAELAWSKDGVRYRISLLNENGAWHIDDVHVGPDKTSESLKEADQARNSADR